MSSRREMKRQLRIFRRALQQIQTHEVAVIEFAIDDVHTLRRIASQALKEAT